MDVWTSKSSPAKQLTAAIGCFIVGLVFLFLTRNFTVENTNEFAAFLLGVLLFSIGGVGILIVGTQTVVVDPRTRRITVEDKNRFRAKRRVIPFTDVAGVSIGFLGKRSNFVSFYYLVLTLRNGKEYPLFAPGRFYEGASNRSIVESWKRRLEKYLGLSIEEVYL